MSQPADSGKEEIHIVLFWILLSLLILWLKKYSATDVEIEIRRGNERQRFRTVTRLVH